MAYGPRDPLTAIADHGGSLERAAQFYPDAPRPWLDLSTGINARSYPLPALSASDFERLPEPGALAQLGEAAARAYGAPSGENIVCAPGTQILLPLVAGLVPAGRAAVLSPTYAEHRRAAAIAGHRVEETSDFGRLASADLAVVVNPNNPDGRTLSRTALLELGGSLGARGGLLVVDEAFMESAVEAETVAGEVWQGGIVVLRSFGKFFGLAGVRLGFAIAAEPLAERLRARLGPWPVSGPAMRIGLAALADPAWQEAMRRELRARAARLDGMLGRFGFEPAGGTTLFRYLKDPAAPSLADTLGRHGILVRAFEFDASALRFGVPGEDCDFERLERALADWRAAR